MDPQVPNSLLADAPLSIRHGSSEQAPAITELDLVRGLIRQTRVRVSEAKAKLGSATASPFRQLASPATLTPSPCASTRKRIPRMSELPFSMPRHTRRKSEPLHSLSPLLSPLVGLLCLTYLRLTSQPLKACSQIRLSPQVRYAIYPIWTVLAWRDAT